MSTKQDIYLNLLTIIRDARDDLSNICECEQANAEECFACSAWSTLGEAVVAILEEEI